MKKIAIAILAVMTVSLPVEGGLLSKFGKGAATASLVASCLRLKPVLCNTVALDKLTFMTINNVQVRDIVSKVFYKQTNSTFYQDKMTNNKALRKRYIYIKKKLQL